MYMNQMNSDFDKSSLKKQKLRMKRILEEVNVLESIDEEEPPEEMSSPLVTGEDEKSVLVRSPFEFVNEVQPPSPDPLVYDFSAATPTAVAKFTSFVAPTHLKDGKFGKVSEVVAFIDKSQSFAKPTPTDMTYMGRVAAFVAAIEAGQSFVMPTCAEVRYIGRVAAVVAAIEGRNFEMPTCTEYSSKQKFKRFSWSTRFDHSYGQVKTLAICESSMLKDNDEFDGSSQATGSAEIQEEDDQLVDEVEEEDKWEEKGEEKVSIETLKKQLIAELKLKLIEMQIYVE